MAELVNERMQKEIVNAAVEMAGRLGVDPRDVLTTMAYETAGSMDPWERGPRTPQYGVQRGLIQMGEPQQARYGYNRYDPVAQQMQAVERYLVDNGVRPGMGLLDIYSAVNAGEVGLYDRTDAANGGAPGTVRDKVEQQMADERALADKLLAEYARNPSNMNGYQDRRVSLSKNERLASLGINKVAQVQEQLAALGYQVEVDGRMGPQTREAIKEFQKDTGAKPTGKVDAATAAKLEAVRQSDALAGSWNAKNFADKNAQFLAAFDPKDRSTWGTNVAPFPDIQSAPGGIIGTGRTIVDGMDYTRAAADLQPGFDQYEAGRNLSRTMPNIMASAGGLLDPVSRQPSTMTQTSPFGRDFGRAQSFGVPIDANRFDNSPAFDAGRFATYQPPAPNSPEKAFENAVRNSYFDGLVNQPAPSPAPTPAGFTPSSPIGATSRTPSGSFTPSSPFSNGLAPAGGLTPAPSKPSAPTIAQGSPQAQSLASAYGAYGTSRAMAPAAPVAPTANAIDVPNSAMSLADQYASYGSGKVAPQTAASATQAAPAPKPSETIQRQAAAAPAMTAAPRTVAPRTVAPYTPPTPTMTPERAKALGMVPTPNVPGAYMPNVAANPAQVMRDQMGLIAANPLEALGRMVVGALQGGVFGPGLNNIQSFAGGLFGGSSGSDATPERTREAYGGSLGGLGGSYTGPGGVGGYNSGGFQAGGGNWGNYGSDGTFNGGFQSSSGFQFDR